MGRRSRNQPGATPCLQDRDALLLAACGHGQNSKTCSSPVCQGAGACLHRGRRVCCLLRSRGSITRTAAACQKPAACLQGRVLGRGSMIKAVPAVGAGSASHLHKGETADETSYFPTPSACADSHPAAWRLAWLSMTPAPQRYLLTGLTPFQMRFLATDPAWSCRLNHCSADAWPLSPLQACNHVPSPAGVSRFEGPPPPQQACCLLSS